MAILMKAYRTVQTGPNIQFGGEKDNLLRDWYHGSMFNCVTNPAIKDDKNVINIIKIKLL